MGREKYNGVVLDGGGMHDKIEKKELDNKSGGRENVIYRISKM